MGKKKNKNKLSGAVKTAAKTEKKLANKLKKELADLGEEDIAKVVAQIELEEAKRLAPKEKNLPGPPSPRAYATLTPHPTNNELILFGGEYHDGQKTQVYNELLFYNPSSNAWRRVKAPGAPPPRSAHQAVATPANKGELWIFGGEFTSLSESQFYHYKDLWCFSLAENKWEKVAAAGGPGARSGHRMALVGRRLVVFGGYTDDGRECRYFDDAHCFCLDTRAWSRLAPAGKGPSPRSACVMVPAGNDSVVIYGGFSRVREGRSERGVTHADVWRLAERAGGGWQWRALGGGGGGEGGAGAPPPRAQLAAALHAHQARAYVFGGVTDVEETEEELRGEMSDDLHILDLQAGKWHRVTLRTPPAPAGAAVPAPGLAPAAPAETVTVITDEVFTMKLGGAQAAPAPAAAAAPAPAAAAAAAAAPAPPGPCARMSAMMAVQRSVLYVYGGVLEKDDKQFCLSDMYSLDLHKLNEWRTLAEQPPLPAWLGSDSDSGSWRSGSGSGHSDSDSDSDTDPDQ